MKSNMSSLNYKDMSVETQSEPSQNIRDRELTKEENCKLDEISFFTGILK